MFKKLSIFLVIALATTLSAATMGPAVELTVGGTPVALSTPEPIKLEDGGQAWVYDPFNNDINFEVSSLIFSFKEDPYVDYAIAVKNFGAVPLSFSFTFLTPYAGGPYFLLDSSHSSSVTDSSPTNGAVTVALDKKGSIHTPNLDGVDILGGALGAGCAPVGAKGFSAGCEAPAGVVGLPVATLAAGTLSVTVNFTLSPGDIYTANGRVEIYNNPIPEPSTYAMAIGGLGLLLAFRRLRA
ncbi:MAG: PEP-CTERM sorting domain-containing protein [Bryobacteraceae bacterium]|nr:PEP-CTERM sorting domain-containing protein [Bryobacteraceae bacterium]